MIFSAKTRHCQRFSAWLAFLLIAYSQSFASGLIAGGWVPERRSLVVTPNEAAGFPVPDHPFEVATIEIDNNLPEYELALDFSDHYGGGGEISEVNLEALDGILGKGLEAPGSTVLEQDAIKGMFIWRPGPQVSATIHYRLRIMVTYKVPRTEGPHLVASMPVPF